MIKYIFLPLGAAFGFILSRAGATTPDFYAKLFLFRDFQLLWVILAAGGVGLAAMFLLRKIKAKSLMNKENLEFKGKPYKKSLIPGSLIFGLGWGLAGACPGTALVMLGEGKLGALFTVLGIVIGTFLFGHFNKPRKVKVKT